MCAGARPPDLCGRRLFAAATQFCLSLQIFSNDGEFKNRFGVRGRSPGQLQRPTGVAVHPSGDIIIADYDNKWVSIFSCEGKFKVCAKANQLRQRAALSPIPLMLKLPAGKTWLRSTSGAKGCVRGPERTRDCRGQQSMHRLHLPAHRQAHY